jgi:hypothetical protein
MICRYAISKIKTHASQPYRTDLVHFDTRVRKGVAEGEGRWDSGARLCGNRAGRLG